MPKHPKTRDERLYIDAKKKAKKQQLRPKRIEDAKSNDQDIEK
jgi:hypothetical protein